MVIIMYTRHDNEAKRTHKPLQSANTYSCQAEWHGSHGQWFLVYGDLQNGEELRHNSNINSQNFKKGEENEFLNTLVWVQIKSNHASAMWRWEIQRRKKKLKLSEIDLLVFLQWSVQIVDKITTMDLIY